jgi:hypothetical protein
MRHSHLRPLGVIEIWPLGAAGISFGESPAVAEIA